MNLQFFLLSHLLLNSVLNLGNGFLHPSWIWFSKVEIWAYIFWTIASRTCTTDNGVDREELGALLIPGADSTGMVSVGFEVA